MRGIRRESWFLNPLWIAPLMGAARNGKLTAAMAVAHFKPPTTEERMSGFPDKLEAFVRRRSAATASKPKATHGLPLIWFLLTRCNTRDTILTAAIAVLFIICRIASQITFSQLMAVFADDVEGLLFTSGGGMPSMAMSVATFCVSTVSSSWLQYQLDL